MAESREDETFVADELFEPTQQRSLRRLPTLLMTATRIARDAAPHELGVTAALQLVLAVAAAVQVLVVRGLLDGLLQLDDGTTVGEIAPWLFAFVGIAALLTFSTTLRVERQRLMGELVAQHTTGEVLDIAASADLLDYETPSFYNRLQRARINAEARPWQMVGGLLTVGGSLMAIVAVAAVLVAVAPLLLLLILVAYVPLWFALDSRQPRRIPLCGRSDRARSAPTALLRRPLPPTGGCRTQSVRSRRLHPRRLRRPLRRPYQRCPTTRQAPEPTGPARCAGKRPAHRPRDAHTRLDGNE